MQIVVTSVLCLCLFAPTWAYRLPHIIGGRDAKIGEFPWQASIQYFGSHICGAALVTERWIITAAHCMTSVVSRSILLGAHDIKTLEEGKPVRYGINRVFLHGGYDKSLDLSPDDIAVVRLDKAATVDGTYVDTVRLPAADDGNLLGAKCTITGWGKTKIGSTGSPNILQAADTTPMTNKECAPLAAKIPDMDITITDGHICVAGQGKEGGCHGDSGGPLTCRKDDGSVILAGVTSGGDALCDTKYPSIYTRISHFGQWLSDMTDGEVSLE